MKKFLTVLLCVVVLVGCGGRHSSTVLDAENEEEKFVVPVKGELNRGTIVLNDIYIQQENTEYGYDGWIVFEFDLSDMSDKDRYWIEEYNFDLDDNYNSKIQDDGKKYVFASIQECEYPLSEMKISLEMDVWCFQEKSFYNKIEGTGSDYKIVGTLPENIELIMNEVLQDYMNIFGEPY